MEVPWRNAVGVLRKSILDGVQGVPNTKAVPSFSKFAEQFLEWAKANVSEATVHLHEITVVSLKRSFHGKLLTEIDSGAVEEFKLWRSKQLRKNGKDRPVSPATTNRALTTLKRIFNYADALGMNVRDPVRHVKFFRESAGRMRVLSIEEVENYLSVSKGDLRDLALLVLETGARSAGIPSFQKADVNSEQSFVSPPGTKTVNARRDVPLAQEALESLRRRSEESPNGYISPVRRPKTKNKQVGHVATLKKAHERAIEKHFTAAPFVPYDFGHTFASRCVQAGAGLAELVALLGHADVSTTMRYIHVLKEQEIAAVDKLGECVHLAKQFRLRAEEQEEELSIVEPGDVVSYYDDSGTPVTITVPQFPHQSSESSMEADKSSSL